MLEPATGTTAPEAPDAPPSAEVVGVPLALTDYAATIDWIERFVQSGARGYMTAAAVHLVMVANEDPATRAAVLGATLAVPDGMPLVWALSALGHRGRCSRVYGPELMARHCERAAQTGRRIYLYGGRDNGALVQLTLNLRRRYPGIQIVGGYSPPFAPPSAEHDRWVAEEINRTGAEIVWVGIGQPKQELWMARMRPLLEAPMLIGVGAAFDFHAGIVPQAPAWMQRTGLEWVFRLWQEPRRLWRRYARYNPRFVLGFARQWMRTRGS
jgi:N-acetylglucosaminyldiphosphoundecaprenol N-acetyl-beta-D-mannosaminyltransferase